MIEYLTLEDVLALTKDLGVGPVRDIGLLASAVHRPRVSAFGREAYPDIDTKAAVLLDYNLVIAIASGTATYQQAAS